MIYLSSTMKLYKSHFLFLFLQSFFLFLFFTKNVGLFEVTKIDSYPQKSLRQTQVCAKMEIFFLWPNPKITNSPIKMSSIRISENRDCNLQKRDIFKDRFFFSIADILNSFDVYKRQSFRSDQC